MSKNGPKEKHFLRKSGFRLEIFPTLAKNPAGRAGGARQTILPSLIFPTMTSFRTTRGRALPLGATALADGINFSLLCRHGTTVSLVLYPPDPAAPLDEIPLDPRKNRTGDHWHVLVSGLPPTFSYGWRVDGPPGNGH